MTSKEYIEKAQRTASGEFKHININVLHGAIGCCTEAGELLDAVKKAMFYGKPLDSVNLKEEIGDLFWYIALICDELGVSFEEIFQMNIAKLAKRYPEKFTCEDALNRDLEEEREVLEARTNE